MSRPSTRRRGHQYFGVHRALQRRRDRAAEAIQQGIRLFVLFGLAVWGMAIAWQLGQWIGGN